MSDQYEFEGKTVEDAVAMGLIELKLVRDQVNIEVIRKGSRGILGFGGENALVRLIPLSDNPGNIGISMQNGETLDEADAESVSTTKSTSPITSESTDLPADDNAIDTTVDSNDSATDDTPSTESADHSSPDASDNEEDEDDTDQRLTSMAVDFLEEIVYLMGYDAEVNAVWKDPEPDETESCLVLSVEGDDLGSLIGRRGETMDSLQYLLRLMINQRIRSWRNIVVDVGGYKEKRSNQIAQLAERMANQVIETGRAVSLEPMPANERRLVHLALREHPDVYTESSGERDRRKVHILPKSLHQ